MIKRNNPVITKAFENYDSSIVKIEKSAIDNFPSLIDTFDYHFTPHSFSKDMSFSEISRYILALNSINHQFWDIDKQGNFYRHAYNNNIGANVLFIEFPRFYQKVKDINSSLINEELLIEHFGKLPELSHRVSILHESLNIQNFNKAFTFINLAIQNNQFNYSTVYEISKIYHLSFKEDYSKKIQLALYDIYFYAKKDNPKLTLDLTIAADYQIPKVLEGLGLISYSDELKAKINNHVLIYPDSKEEHAIRSASILACELICDTHKIPIPVLDKQLWLMRNDFKNSNFHLTRTTNY